MGTFDITLPNNKVVIFSPRCVVCEKKNPDRLIKLSFLGIKTTPILTIAVDEAVFDNVDPKCYGSNTNHKYASLFNRFRFLRNVSY